MIRVMYCHQAASSIIIVCGEGGEGSLMFDEILRLNIAVSNILSSSIEPNIVKRNSTPRGKHKLPQMTIDSTLLMEVFWITFLGLK